MPPAGLSGADLARAARARARAEAKRRAQERARARAQAAARARAAQARVSSQRANETRGPRPSPTPIRTTRGRDGAASLVSPRTRRSARRNLIDASVAGLELPALGLLAAGRAGRGDLLTPAEFKAWRVKHGRFSTTAGGHGARAPTYQDYLRFIERRRGLEGSTRIRERVERGQFDSPAREARRADQQPDESLYGRLPASTAEALALNRRNALPERDDGGILNQVWDVIRPGGGLDKLTGLDAGKVAEFSSWLDSQGDRFEDWVRNYLGDRKLSVSVAPGVVQEHDAASLASIPVKIPAQVAAGVAYTPAFIAYGITDPKGTARGIADYAASILRDPTRFMLDRPGDALMLIIGGKGLVSGRLPNVVKAAARGDMRAAAHAAITPAPSTGALTRGTPRVLRPDLDNVIPGRAGRRATQERDLVARIEAAEPETLVRIADRLVIPKPEHTSRKQMRVAQSEAVRAVMEQTTPRERAAFYLDARTMGRPAARQRLNRLVEANRIVETLGLVERGPDGLRISDRYPALQALTSRVIESSRRQERTKLELGVLDTEQAIRRRDAPGELIRQLDGSDEFDLGPTVYSPYKLDLPDVRSLIPPRLRDRLGIPQKDAVHSFTGRALRSGRVGNVIRLTAREELSTLRYQGRLQAWKDAIASSITGRELLRRVEAGDNLSDYAAVRVKAGKTSIPTRQVLSELFGNIQVDTARHLVDITSDRLAGIDDIRVIAREADRSGQVRFFKPDEVGLHPLEMTRPGAFRTTVRLVNQIAKTSVLFLAGPAYALPNLIGQAGFSLIHKGVRQPFNDFWEAPRVLGKLSEETRNRFRAIGGTGITKAIQPGMGPLAKLRQLNQELGNFYARFLDDFWRDGAVYYEAKLRGYTTPADLERLATRSTKRGTREHRDMLEINRAVGEHFGEFDRLTDFEKSYVSEAIFFWPWIRASAVLTAKVVKNHPAKAALLEIGGSYSYEKARQDFISMFRSEGVDEKTAGEMTDKLMRLMPGVFLVGDKLINPLAVSLYSSPLEIGQVFQPLKEGDWDRFLSNLFDQGAPFVSIAGALIEGVFDQDADPAAQRVLESIEGYSRDVTLLKRLYGDQGKWFTYTPIEAFLQRFAGSFTPRGVNVEGLLESVRADQDRAAREAGPRDPARKAAGAGQYRRRDRAQYGGIGKTRSILNEAISDLDTIGDLTDEERTVAKQALGVKYQLEEALDAASGRNGRMDRRKAAEIALGFIERYTPEWAEMAREGFANASTDDEFYAFYREARAALEEKYPWGDVERWLKEQNGGG